MCRRASLSVDPDELREAFGLTDMPAAILPRYNMAPSQPLPIIREPGRLDWCNGAFRSMDTAWA